MDRICESTSLFPLERVPRFLSVTSRSDGTVCVDDLDQLHTELEKLFGAASLHVNTIEQYLCDEERIKTKNRESKVESRSKHKTHDVKKQKDSLSKARCRYTPESSGGIDFSRLRELDEKEARSGNCFLFATLRDTITTDSATPAGPYGNGVSSAYVAASVGANWSARSAPSAPKKTCYKVALSNVGPVSHDEPITLRVLRSATHSRRNSVSTASTSSPSTNDDARARRSDQFSPTPSQRCNGERRSSNGLLTATAYDGASRLIGGRILRNRAEQSATYFSSCSSPQRTSFSPQSDASDSRSKMSAASPRLAVSDTTGLHNMSTVGCDVRRTGSLRLTSDGEMSPAAASTSTLATNGRKRGRPTKPSSKPAAAHSLPLAFPRSSIDTGISQNRLFASYRHEVPKAFWRQFDELFMRDLRSDDIEFFSMLRTQATLADAELARLNTTSSSHAHSYRLLSPCENGARNGEYDLLSPDTDDPPIRKRLRLRNTSGPHDAARNGQSDWMSGPAFRAPPSISSTTRLREREKEQLGVTLRSCSSSSNASTKRGDLRNGFATMDASPPFSPSDERDAIMHSLRTHDPSVTLRNRDDWTNYRECKFKAANGESGNRSSHECVLTRTELNALSKLVDAERQTMWSRREQGQPVPVPTSVPTKVRTDVASGAKRHLVVATNDELKIRIRLASTSSSSSSTARPKATPSTGTNTTPATAADSVRPTKSAALLPNKRQRVAEVDMNAQMTANLLICISDTASCEMHLAKLLPSVPTASSAANGKRDRERPPHRTLSLKALVGRTGDDSTLDDALKRDRRSVDEDTASCYDVTKPLTVRTPEKYFAATPFALPASADNRLLLSTSSIVRKLSESESDGVELQRLFADLRCTNEWTRNAFDSLLSIATSQFDRQPLLNRLRRLERTIAELNVKMNDSQRCTAICNADVELAKRAIEEREAIFRKLDI